MLSEMVIKFAWAPTPISTLISSLIFVAVLIIVYTVYANFRSRRRKEENVLDRVVDRLRAFDKWLVKRGSVVVGTSFRLPLTRRIAVPCILTSIAAVSTIFSAPFGLFVIIIGLIAILIVFRHWFRDEDIARDLAELNKIPNPKDKEVPIIGDLSVEVVTASAFIMVFACIAFAQIADAGLGFQIKPDAGPFAFVVYALIEMLKAGSLIDYYDLFANQLPFDQMSDVKTSRLWAKGAVLSYRFCINVLLLAVLMRVIDITRRQAEGRDLRHIRAMLSEQDVEVKKLAVIELEAFALRGRANAAVELERIVQPEAGFSANLRYDSAEALQKYGQDLGIISALHVSAEAFRYMADKDWSRELNPQKWAEVQLGLGLSLQNLGSRAHHSQYLDEAIIAYENALEILKEETSLGHLIRAKIGLANSLYHVGERTHSAEKYRAAIELFKSVIGMLPKEELYSIWAIAQNGLGNSLERLAKLDQNADLFHSAIEAYEEAIEKYNIDMEPDGWAIAQDNLGNTLASLADLAWDKDLFDRAMIAFNSALEIKKRDKQPIEWARTQNNIGVAWVTRAKNESSNSKDQEMFLQKAVTAFQMALQEWDLERTAFDWSLATLNLARALKMLARANPKSALIVDSINHYRAALDVLSYEHSPRVWIAGWRELGTLYQSQGKSEIEGDGLREALQSYKTVIDEIDEHDYPKEWVQLQHDYATTLRSYSEQLGDVPMLCESITALETAVRSAKKYNYADTVIATMTDLGIAHLVLADIEQDPAHLAQSISVLSDALARREEEYFIQEDALCLMELGIAYTRLGQGTESREVLEKAVDFQRLAYRSIGEENKECKAGKHPLLSSILSNTGLALTALGQLSGDVETLLEAGKNYALALQLFNDENNNKRLDDAVKNIGMNFEILTNFDFNKEQIKKFDNLIDEVRLLTRDSTFVKHLVRMAYLHVALGTAQNRLANQEYTTTRFEDAILSYRSALEVWTRDRDPENWVKVTVRLATALDALGVSEQLMEPIEEAVACLKDVLSEIKQEENPQQWAITQNNCGLMLRNLGELQDESKNIEEALLAFEAALDVFTPEADSRANKKVLDSIEVTRKLLNKRQKFK